MMRPDIEEITARANAATQGPWAALDYDPDGMTFIDQIQHAYEGQMLFKDAVFVAHAREDIPALLGYIAKLEAMLPIGDVLAMLKYFKDMKSRTSEGEEALAFTRAREAELRGGTGWEPYQSGQAFFINGRRVALVFKDGDIDAYSAWTDPSDQNLGPWNAVHPGDLIPQQALDEVEDWVRQTFGKIQEAELRGE